MKKLLITSTAMVVASTAAFADGHSGVALSGYAEIGFKDAGAGDIEFHHDMDVSFKLSGQTDNGLTFGAKVDLDEISSGIPAGSGAHTVFIGGDSWKITMGDTDGALDKALTEVAFLTAIADDHSTHAGYSGNSALDGSGDGQVLRFDYSFDAFTLSVSMEQFDDGVTSDDDIYGIGGSFSTDLGGTDLSIGLGYQTQDTVDAIGASVGFGISGFDVVLNYWDLDGPGTAGDVTYMAIGVAYTIDALSFTANYGDFDRDGSVEDTSGFGIAVNYDLGGGAVVMLGYGDSDYNAGNSQGTGGTELFDADTWSIGLGLSF